jgi:hypothetical protein
VRRGKSRWVIIVDGSAMQAVICCRARRLHPVGDGKVFIGIKSKGVCSIIVLAPIDLGERLGSRLSGYVRHPALPRPALIGPNYGQAKLGSNLADASVEYLCHAVPNPASCHGEPWRNLPLLISSMAELMTDSPGGILTANDLTLLLGSNLDSSNTESFIEIMEGSSGTRSPSGTSPGLVTPTSSHIDVNPLDQTSKESSDQKAGSDSLSGDKVPLRSTKGCFTCRARKVGPL